MSRCGILRTCIVAATLVLVAGSGFAQNPGPPPPPGTKKLQRWLRSAAFVAHRDPAPPESHRDIPLPDIDPARLQQRWQDVEASLKARNDLQTLAQEILQRPELLQNDPKQREKLEQLVKQSGVSLDPNNPLVRQMEQWLKQHRTQKGGPRMSREAEAELKKLLETIQKIEASSATLPQIDSPTPQPPPEPTALPAPGSGTARPALSAEEQAERLRFTRWLLEQSQRLERGRFQDSDLMREIRRDVQQFATRDTPPLHAPRLGNDELNRRLHRLTHDVQSSQLWSRINLPMPRLSLPERTLPRLPSLGSWGRPPSLGGVPRLGTPSLPNKAPSGDLLLSLVGLAAAALLAWRLVVLLGIGQRRGKEANPPDWTVVPGAVVTGADLIRAFEHLSLSRLGVEARSWNHRRIAARLGGGDAARQSAATVLCSLYERARYAPEASPLSPDEVHSAQQSLALLCGGPVA